VTSVSLPTRTVQHRKRIVFHVPVAIEQACAFRFLRAVREQFGSGVPVFRNMVFPDFKIGTVERGRGWLSYGGRRCSLEPGMVYVLFPGQPVSFGPDQADPMEVTFAVVVGEGVTLLLADVGLTPESPVAPVGPAPELREVFRALRDRQGAFVPRAHGQLWSLLARVAEATGRASLETGHKPSHPITPAARLASRDPAVSRALAAVRLHLHEPELRVADLAQAAYLGRSQFMARFRREMACAPAEYVERLRLVEARALLADEDLSVTEIAHRVGFRDPAYFARRFRRATGESPSEFRLSAQAPGPAPVQSPGALALRHRASRGE
jgi:AraC-like DNA-binding protein